MQAEHNSPSQNSILKILLLIFLLTDTLFNCFFPASLQLHDCLKFFLPYLLDNVIDISKQ